MVIAIDTVRLFVPAEQGLQICRASWRNSILTMSGNNGGHTQSADPAAIIIAILPVLHQQAATSTNREKTCCKHGFVFFFADDARVQIETSQDELLGRS